MAKIGVGLKINVSEIERERLFAGTKGKYLDATVFIDLDEKDQFGNSGMITQDVTREEKEQGVKGPILGNCRIFWQGEGHSSTPQPSAQPQAGQALPDDNDPIPF